MKEAPGRPRDTLGGRGLFQPGAPRCPWVGGWPGRKGEEIGEEETLEESPAQLKGASSPQLLEWGCGAGSAVTKTELPLLSVP